MQTEYTKAFDLELKTEDLEDGTFEGHCAVFGNIDLQGDKIQRNAFVNTIMASKGRWPILMAHRSDIIVGFSTDAREDNKGLWVRGELTLDSSAGRDAYAVMKHAAKAEQKLGLSIGYRIRENGAEIEERTGIRLLKDLEVMEFSIAATPANIRARVSRVKSAADWSIREFEEHLREVGFSQRVAKIGAAEVYRALDTQRDVDAGVEECAARQVMAKLCGEQILYKMREF